LPGGHVLVVGSDNQWFKGQDDVLVIDDNKAQAHALYTQLRPQIDALPNWHPSVGMRHEAMSGGESATVGMLTSLYDLNDHWALRGQYGTAYKLPNAEQRFGNRAGQRERQSQPKAGEKPQRRTGERLQGTAGRARFQRQRHAVQTQDH